jgi:hypothetical protein
MGSPITLGCIRKEIGVMTCQAPRSLSRGGDALDIVQNVFLGGRCFFAHALASYLLTGSMSHLHSVCSNQASARLGNPAASATYTKANLCSFLW